MYRETRFVTNYRRPPPFPRLHYLNVTNHPDDHYYFQNFFFETDLLFRLNTDRLCLTQMHEISIVLPHNSFPSHTSSSLPSIFPFINPLWFWFYANKEDSRAYLFSGEGERWGEHSSRTKKTRAPFFSPSSSNFLSQASSRKPIALLATIGLVRGSPFAPLLSLKIHMDQAGILINRPLEESSYGEAVDNCVPSSCRQRSSIYLVELNLLAIFFVFSSREIEEFLIRVSRGIRGKSFLDYFESSLIRNWFFDIEEEKNEWSTTISWSGFERVDIKGIKGIYFYLFFRLN